MRFQIDYKLTEADEGNHSMIVMADNKTEAKREFMTNNKYYEILNIDKI